MPAGVETPAEPLAMELARVQVLPAAQAVDIVRQLAHEVARRHESGHLHLRIVAEMIGYDSASGRAALREPPDEARSFGHENSDDEFCPPELLLVQAAMPVDLAAAREALRTAGLSDIDPRRVDIYQLGTLLCRLLTGESVSVFLSRPRVAARVAPEIRDLIERALGHDSQRAFRSAKDLLRQLESLDATVTVALPSVQPGSTRNSPEPDTTPSFVGVGKADTDAGRPAPTPLDDDSLPFHKLSHYEIVGRLGRGGMGDVYKGYEPQLDRHVAIKVLPAEFSRQDEMVRRFYAEASAAAKLVHPNTVEIHFIGQDEITSPNGQPSKVHFFAMRFVEGESLADLLARRQRLNVDESLAIIEQALAGLSAAHRLGMVHRDIKPGNILIDRERQRVLLADFGLVKSLQSAASMTASGMIVGTVDYMAPEQGRGEAVDARADLYAIGVVLYQMLSGRLPFQADSPTGMIFKHVYETPPPLHDIAPNVPRSLAEIVSKLMSKSPDARHQTVEALLADLKAFHQGQPLPSSATSVAAMLERPRSVIIPAPRFAEESMLPATLTQIAAPDRWRRTRQAVRDFLLIPAEEFVQQLQTTENQVDGAITEYERRHQSLVNAVRDAESVVQEYETELETWRRAIADAEQRATSAREDDSARAALAEKLRAERVLSELSEQLESQQSQLSEMRHKLSQVSGQLESLRSQRDVLNVRLKVARAQIRLAGGEVPSSRNASWLVMIRWQNVAMLSLAMVILGVATSVLTDIAQKMFLDRAARTPSEPPEIEVHPNPALASARSSTEIYVSPPTIVSQPFSGCSKHVLDLAVSPTGTYAAATSGDPMVFVWDAESGQLLHRITENLTRVNAVAFSPDGKTLATGESFGAANSTLKLWNPRTGESLGSLSESSRDILRLAFASQGSWLAAGSLGELIKVWNHEARNLHWTIPDSRGNLHLAFSSDGALLASLTTDWEVRVWNLSERKLLKSWFIDRTSTARSFGLFFSEDGSNVLTAQGQDSIATWSARTGERLSQTSGGLLTSTAAALSPDGHWLASSNSKWITILDAKSGIARSILPGHGTTKLTFSPEGDRLFSGGGHPFVVRSDLALPTLTGRGPSFEITAGPLRAFSRDKPFCLLNVGSQIVVWNHEKRSSLLALKTDSNLDVAQSVAAFSPGSLHTALLDDRNRLHIWNVATGDRLLNVQIPGERAAIPEITFSSNSETVWVKTARGLWKTDLRQTEPEAWWDWPPGVDATSLSPNGEFAVASTKQPLTQVWDMKTRQPIFRSEEYPYAFKFFAFTSDSRKLLGLTPYSEFFLWDIERRELLQRFSLSGNQATQTQGILFLPDQRNFLDFYGDRLRIVDSQLHQELIQFGQTSIRRVPESRLALTSQPQMTFDGRYAVTDSTSPGRIAFWDLYLHQFLGKPQPESASGIQP